MGKKRCEIDAKFKWNIKDLIKDEEEYEKDYNIFFHITLLLKISKQ